MLEVTALDTNRLEQLYSRLSRVGLSTQRSVWHLSLSWPSIQWIHWSLVWMNITNSGEEIVKLWHRSYSCNTSHQYEKNENLFSLKIGIKKYISFLPFFPIIFALVLLTIVHINCSIDSGYKWLINAFSVYIFFRCLSESKTKKAIPRFAAVKNSD